MKSIKLIILSIITIITFNVNAGVISGGGGDVVEANPINDVTLVTNVVRYYKGILKTWLYEKEEHYLLNRSNNRSEVEESIDIYSFLFESKIDIFNVIKN